MQCTFNNRCGVECSGPSNGSATYFKGYAKKYEFQKRQEIYKKYNLPIRHDIKNILLPTIPVKIFHDFKKKFSDDCLPFIFDTSSEHTYIPKKISDSYGIDTRGHILNIISGPAGRVSVFIKIVQIEICDIHIPIQVMIPTEETPEDPFPCLGLSEVLDHLVFAIGNSCTHVFQKKDLVIESQ